MSTRALIVRRQWVLWALSAALAAALLLLLPDLASAQQAEAQRPAKEIADIIQQWAQYLLPGIAALIALVFLLNRRFNEMAVWLVVVVVVGIVVYSGDSISNLATAIGNAIK
jgi:uncharacterized membrane protein YgdD (TMEM256/DUF423 family)